MGMETIGEEFGIIWVHALAMVHEYGITDRVDRDVIYLIYPWNLEVYGS